MDILLQSLQTGFIDKNIHSNKEYLPQFLVNDKSTNKKVLTTIIKELYKCDEFWFSVAFVTTSGVATLLNTLIHLRDKGIKGKILVSQYLNFTQPEALKRLLQFDNIELKIAVKNDLHSKGYLYKSGELYDLIIGSSNLTASALCLNKEWNLKITARTESDIIYNAINEFKLEFDNAIKVDYDFIDEYQKLYNYQFDYNKRIENKLQFIQSIEIKPNSMQTEALYNLNKLRNEKKTKALLISATGTGKTYLSAFDAKDFNPTKLLFVVHRENIAAAAMKTFKKVFGISKTMGMYSGNQKELQCDFIFSTIQTISKELHLKQFPVDHFEYIVIDETHRAGAESYHKIFNYFNPKFLLGMTATPERTDGLDIFKLFDYNIAYEIRLHQAMDEDMLSPFHYYGITDITINGEILKENSDFSLLTSFERINHIIEKAKFYGCDNGLVRGLVFCSKIEECNKLSFEFNQRGYKTISLTGDSTDLERTDAINRLESDSSRDRIDYIFTVDIFNEGIDIPRVNQVILLRPTQSSIVFIQQLGRGLRKEENKEYLTILDFIGNYNNSYLIPIALYGDNTYNKDSLRKLMTGGSRIIPGTSTINFDKISKERIFNTIDSANMSRKIELVNDYKLLKFKLGRIPLMIDFIEHGSRDPFLYVEYSKSYYNFVLDQEKDAFEKLNAREIKILELFAKEINNTKRVEESIILRELIKSKSITKSSLRKIVFKDYGYNINDVTIDSCINNLNFGFVTEKKNNKLLTIQSIYEFAFISRKGDIIFFEAEMNNILTNPTFIKFFNDNVQYSIKVHNALFKLDLFFNGFILYRKYSRKDVFRILNWEKNPVAQNVGGYILSPEKKNCPIFVNYHKEDTISETTKYEDHFINNYEFAWMSKSNRTINSSDVQSIKSYKNGLRLPLFIKKNNDEGAEFYYMGDVTPIENSFEQTTMPDNKKVSVVKVKFLMDIPVEDSIYNYITNHNLVI